MLDGPSPNEGKPIRPEPISLSKVKALLIWGSKAVSSWSVDASASARAVSKYLWAFGPPNGKTLAPFRGGLRGS